MYLLSLNQCGPLPEMNGLEVITEVGAERMPLTVFVTAYDEHAIRAFEANALDYLLKPFSDELFEVTMARVSIRMAERSVQEFGRRILRMVSAAPAGDLPLNRLVVKSGGSTRFVKGWSRQSLLSLSISKESS